jgi:hypothetical protein
MLVIKFDVVFNQDIVLKCKYLIHFILRIYHKYLEILQMFTGMKCSPIQSFIFGLRYVPIQTTFKFLGFLKSRYFVGLEPPEAFEYVPEIVTIISLEISDLTSTQPGWAVPKRNQRESYKQGNLKVCCRQNVLCLATSTSSGQLQSYPPLGRACFLLGSVGKGFIYGKNLEIYLVLWGRGSRGGKLVREGHAQLWSSGGFVYSRTWGARKAGGEMYAEGGAGAAGLTCVECSVMVGVR